MRRVTQRNERIQHVTERLGDSLKEKMGNKTMHGQYVGSIDRQLVIEENMFLWLSRGG